MSDYLTRLDSVLKSRLNELSEQIKGHHNPDAKVPGMNMLLSAALKNEWETTLLTSHWVCDEENPSLRVALSRLAGDEAKHYQLIEERLKNLNTHVKKEDLDQRTPLYKFLIQQKTSFDRAVTGPFTREALAVIRNEVFLEHCESIGDTTTLELYHEIQEDEAHHHQLGRKFLELFITNDEEYEHAKSKMLETLQVVDDIQEMAVMQKGICKLPGC